MEGLQVRVHPCPCWDSQMLQDDVHGLSQVVHVGIRPHLGVVFIRWPGGRQRAQLGKGRTPDRIILLPTESRQHS